VSILVVDDDKGFREGVVDLLSDYGYKVSEAKDPIYAIDQFDIGSFDLVITDILMPEQDGIFLIDHIKNVNPDLKIIAMSGGGRIGADSCLTFAERLEVSRTLKKPFMEEDLLEMLKSLNIVA